jgi:hypothetical protein
MADLATWQKKIQDKRKQTPFRDFVRDICSWYPLSFYKTELGITRYPNTERQ